MRAIFVGLYSIELVAPPVRWLMDSIRLARAQDQALLVLADPGGPTQRPRSPAPEQDRDVLAFTVWPSRDTFARQRREPRSPGKQRPNIAESDRAIVISLDAALARDARRGDADIATGVVVVLDPSQ
jgi:hypothetical protein